MQENTFNCNSLYRCFSRTSNETLQLSVYNNTVSLSIFRKNSENRQPIVKIPLCPEACIQIATILKTLLDAQPDTRIPYIHLVFNKETRSYEQYTTAVFFKDDKRCYGIEVSNRQYSTPMVFPIKSPSSFTTGNEPLNDEKKSTLGLKYLLQIFETDIPLTRNLTRFNMRAPQRGNLTRKSGSGPSKDPFGSSDLGSSEDSPVF